MEEYNRSAEALFSISNCPSDNTVNLNQKSWFNQIQVEKINKNKSFGGLWNIFSSSTPDHHQSSPPETSVEALNLIIADQLRQEGFEDIYSEEEFMQHGRMLRTGM